MRRTCELRAGPNNNQRFGTVALLPRNNGNCQQIESEIYERPTDKVVTDEDSDTDAKRLQDEERARIKKTQLKRQITIFKYLLIAFYLFLLFVVFIVLAGKNSGKFRNEFAHSWMRDLWSVVEYLVIYSVNVAVAYSICLND